MSAGLNERCHIVVFNCDRIEGVEYNPTRMWDGSQNYGASLKAYEKLGREIGYSLVGCDPIGVNAFFVRDEFAKNRFAEPFTAENHFAPARFSFIHRMGMTNAMLDIKSL
jgi:hypothetical protein